MILCSTHTGIYTNLIPRFNLNNTRFSFEDHAIEYIFILSTNVELISMVCIFSFRPEPRLLRPISINTHFSEYFSHSYFLKKSPAAKYNLVHIGEIL